MKKELYEHLRDKMQEKVTLEDQLLRCKGEIQRAILVEAKDTGNMEYLKIDWDRLKREFVFGRR